MAGPIIHALSLPQWGMESVKAPGIPGAAVPATKKMAVKDFLIRPTDSISRDESPLKGMLIANRGGEVIMARGTEWEVPETPYFFDEAHYWLAMAILGGVAVAGATWTYTANPLVLGAGKDLRTIELGLGDGATTSDWEIPACFLQEIEWSGTSEQAVRFSAKGMGRRLVTSTRTPALAMFPLVGVGSPLSKVFIDPSFATLGTTQVTGQITGWRFRLETGLQGQTTTDGRTDMDYGVAILNPENVKVTIEMDFKANASSAIWLTERTAAEAATLRAVEIRLDNTATYQSKFQALVKHSQASVFPNERANGEVMGKFVFEGSTDETNFLRCSVTNTIVAAVA